MTGCGRSRWYRRCSHRVLRLHPACWACGHGKRGRKGSQVSADCQYVCPLLQSHLRLHPLTIMASELHTLEDSDAAVPREPNVVPPAESRYIVHKPRGLKSVYAFNMNPENLPDCQCLEHQPQTAACLRLHTNNHIHIHRHTHIKTKKTYQPLHKQTHAHTHTHIVNQKYLQPHTCTHTHILAHTNTHKHKLALYFLSG